MNQKPFGHYQAVIVWVMGLALSVAFAAGAMAQSISLRTVTADAELEKFLKGSSRVFTAAENEASTSRDLIAAAQGDYRALVTALYSKGYFGSSVSVLINGVEAADVSPFNQPDQIGRIAITVDPGPPFVFGRLEIAPLAPDTTIASAFSTGSPAISGEVRNATQAALRGWQDIGHAKVEVTDQEVIADHSESRLNVRVALEPGPRLTFGDVTITGNEAVSTERVRAIAGLPEGELVTPTQLRDAERRLTRTGTFRSTNFVPDEVPNDDGTLDYTIEVQEQKPRRLGFGAEFNSSEGITLSAFWLHRNIMGGAEQLRFDGDITWREGELEYNLRGTYRRPATFRPTVDMLFAAEILREDLDDYVENQFGVFGGFERRYSDRLTVGAGVMLSYTRTEFEFDTRTFQIFGVPLQLTWDDRDVETDATRGIYAFVEAMPFVGAADADSGLRATLDARAYRSLGDDVVFAARGQIGSVFGVERGFVPESFLFFSGGSGTVRGHEYRSLGVEVGDSVLGGAGYLGFSLEARYAFSDTLGIVAFYDYGYVSADSLPSGDGDSQSGAGLGARYNTPIGPIRFDIAAPVTGNGSGFQFYIGIGQAF